MWVFVAAVTLPSPLVLLLLLLRELSCPRPAMPLAAV